MEDLSRAELQKLCRDYRSSGKLPKDTKCTGTTSALWGIVRDLYSPKREEIVKREGDPLEVSSKSPYSSRILRALAPYLTYDKLLDLVQRYPQSNLLDELKDPQGSIWKERVIIETGEPPIDLGNFSTRYYHQWSTEILSPWGELVVFLKKGFVVETGVRVQWAYWDYAYSASSSGKRIGLGLWAKTSRGFEHFATVREADLTIEGFKEEFKKAENWKILSKGSFRSFWGLGINRCLALDLLGNLHYFSFEGGLVTLINKGREIKEEILDLGIKIRDMKKTLIQKAYLKTFEGEHLFLNALKKSFILSRPLLDSQVPPGVITPFGMSTLSPENVYFVPKNPQDTFVLPLEHQMNTFSSYQSLYHIERTHYEGMDKEKLYYLPNPVVIEKIYKETGITYLSSPYYISNYYILSTKGDVYQAKEDLRSMRKLKYIQKFSKFWTTYDKGSYGIRR